MAMNAEPFAYEKATDLEYAWLNFELDLPLPPEEHGEPNPFYVERASNPAARLQRELLRPYRQPPKYFFSGHRGCGKSTELYRLAAQPSIRAKYWPAHFSIRNEADINNLDFRDVLLAIGGQMYRQYQEQGGRLPEQMLKELDSWRGRIEEHVTITRSRFGAVVEGGLSGKLNLFFGEIGTTVKLEPTTRRELRQVLEHNVTELVGVINSIATAIYAAEKKPPLILIDDLDKPDIEAARAIFYDHREIMRQPICPIVYTVSSSLFYSAEFDAIRNDSIFLPNVRTHPHGAPAVRHEEGYATLRAFVEKRMLPELIDADALDHAAKMSGGVFREMARLMRSAIDRTLATGHERVMLRDVEDAAAEIRGEYRRILTAEQRDLLREIRDHNQLGDPHAVAPLLQLLAVLEYANGEPWYDVHPVLNKLLDEEL